MQKSLNKVLSQNFINYQGCIIERTKDGFKSLGQVFATLENAQINIDRAYLNFKISR